VSPPQSIGESLTPYVCLEVGPLGWLAGFRRGCEDGISALLGAGPENFLPLELGEVGVAVELPLLYFVMAAEPQCMEQNGPLPPPFTQGVGIVSTACQAPFPAGLGLVSEPPSNCPSSWGSQSWGW
jgi:hypothetical protein